MRSMRGLTAMDGKPEAAKLGWRVLGTKRALATPFTVVRQDTVRVAGGTEILYTYEQRPDAVGIVPVTPDGQILLIRQYRYPIDAWCLEIPAGGTRDHPDLALEAVARLELREEIGADCKKIEYVGAFYVVAASRDQRFHVFLACGVTIGAPTAHESTERIELCAMPIAEALDLARTGRIPESQSALSLLLCEEHLRAFRLADTPGQ